MLSLSWLPAPLRRIASRAVAIVAGYPPPFEVTDPDDLRRNARVGWRNDDAALHQHRAYQPLLANMYAGEPRRDLVVAAQAIEAAGVDAASVLEVGCGSGYYSEVLAHLVRGGVRYAGLDISPHMVALARRSYPTIPFAVADAEALPFMDASFDVVLNGVSLTHVPDYGAAMRESARVARRLSVFHTVAVTAERPTTVVRHRAYGQTFVERVFNEDELRRTIEESSLRVRETLDSIPYDLRAVVGAPTRTYTFICESAVR